MKFRPNITGVCLSLVLLVAARAEPIPIIFDTDIGTDVDDVYALAHILHSPELKLLGVTTVSGDAVARARTSSRSHQCLWSSRPTASPTSSQVARRTTRSP